VETLLRQNIHTWKILPPEFVMSSHLHARSKLIPMLLQNQFLTKNWLSPQFFSHYYFCNHTDLELEEQYSMKIFFLHVHHIIWFNIYWSRVIKLSNGLAMIDILLAFEY
jgi:hypothetical protein